MLLSSVFQVVWLVALLAVTAAFPRPFPEDSEPTTETSAVEPRARRGAGQASPHIAARDNRWPALQVKSAQRKTRELFNELETSGLTQLGTFPEDVSDDLANEMNANYSVDTQSLPFLLNLTRQLAVFRRLFHGVKSKTANRCGRAINPFVRALDTLQTSLLAHCRTFSNSGDQCQADTKAPTDIIVFQNTDSACEAAGEALRLLKDRLDALPSLGGDRRKRGKGHKGDKGGKGGKGVNGGKGGKGRKDRKGKKDKKSERLDKSENDFAVSENTHELPADNVITDSDVQQQNDNTKLTASDSDASSQDPSSGLTTDQKKRKNKKEGKGKGEGKTRGRGDKASRGGKKARRKSGRNSDKQGSSSETGTQ